MTEEIVRTIIMTVTKTKTEILVMILFFDNFVWEDIDKDLVIPDI